MQQTQDAIWKSVRSFILRTLPRDGLSNTESEISALQLPDLLIRYVNWWTRFVPQMPRKVHLSTRMTSYLSRASDAPSVHRLANMIETGQPLWPHLSRGIKKGYVAGAYRLPKKLTPKHRPDIDLLLNDWTLHHLHLGFTTESDGFNNRTDPVVVAYFCQGHAFLIDVINHNGEWSRDRIFQSILETWSDWVLLPKLEGVVGLSDEISEDDRQLLRKAGLVTPIEVSGAVHVPVFGLSTAGTSARASMMADHILDGLDWAAERLKRYDPERLGLGFDVEGYRVRVTSDLLRMALPIDLRRFFPVPTSRLT